MDEKSLKVLLIEDNPGDARLIREMLKESGDSAFSLEVTDQLARGLLRLSDRGIDVVLVDLSLPDSNGMETFVQVQKQAPELPIMVMTGLNDQTVALKAIEEGAQDYLVKGQVNAQLLSRCILYAVERKRAELELRDLNEDLQRSNDQLKKAQAGLLQSERLAAVGQLAAGVAHEINNPTSFVLSNLQSLIRYFGLLKKSYTQAKAIALDHAPPEISTRFKDMEAEKEIPFYWTDCLDLINESLEGMERIREIVKDLRIFAGSPTEENREVDVNLILKTIISMLKNQISYRAQLIEDLAPLPPLLGNDAKLGQVFMNLIHNALQAIPEGNVQENRIEISTREVEGDIRLTVRDTGHGIPEENLTRIFDPFFTTKPVGEGTGLGLAISYDIVKQHGGRIEVESAANRGSAFTVILPLALRQDAEQVFREKAGSVVSASPLTVARILLVDDEDHILKSYTRALPRTFNVITAQGGKSALAVLEADKDFDAVVCDMMMPDFSGDQVYRQAVEKHPDLAGRFIFITGGAFTPKTREFVMGTQSRCLEKPFRIEALIENIRQIMENRDESGKKVAKSG